MKNRATTFELLKFPATFQEGDFIKSLVRSKLFQGNMQQILRLKIYIRDENEMF